MNALPLAAGSVDATIDRQLLNRVVELQAKAKSEIQRLVSVLDFAVSSVSKVADQIDDPDVRKTIESQLSAIEETLRVAQEKTSAL